MTMKFPVCIEARRETIQKWRFDILWRGDTIIKMLPCGDKVPLYQRDFMNTHQVPYRPKPETPKRLNTVHW